MPRRAAVALERGMLLGLRLLGADDQLRSAIRLELEAGGAHAPEGRAPHRVEGVGSPLVVDLEARRRKLLTLYYEDKIGPDLYAEQEAALRQQIANATAEARAREAEVAQRDDVTAQFEAVAAVLAELDVEAVWLEATQDERRVLVQELVDEVALFPDHLEVVVAEAPRLNVTLEEVGVQNCGVRRGTRNIRTRLRRPVG